MPAAPVPAAWPQVLNRLLEFYGDAIFRSWLKSASCEERDGELAILLPTSFMRDRVEHTYGAKVLEIVRKEMPGAGRVVFEIGEGLKTQEAQDASALDGARTEDEILRAVAEAESAGPVPNALALAMFFGHCPESALEEATTRLQALYGARASWRLDADPAETLFVVAPSRGRAIVVRTIEEMHTDWARLENRPVHPLGPLVAAWQQRPQRVQKATVTAVLGMTRRPEPASLVRRAHWVSAVEVDGDPMAMALPDAHDFFAPPGRRRIRRLSVYRPSESQGLMRLPGVLNAPSDWRLSALSGMEGGLAGDSLELLTLAHALDRPIRVSSAEGAALLARTMDGGYRMPRESDQARFWEAASQLAAVQITDPYGSSKWANLARVEGHPAEDYVVIGPPEWAQGRNLRRWTLTAEGGLAGRRRIVAGRKGGAGRMVTGLEYRLAAAYDARLGRSVHLQPASGRAGPGPPVFIPWRETLWSMGDHWDVEDAKADHAARKRWQRIFATLTELGYRVPSLRGEAEAGDSIEIVNMIGGGRGRTAGLRVRASARMVAAAALAERGSGFSPVPLEAWLGLPDEPPPASPALAA